MKNKRQKLALACCVPIITAILLWTLQVPVKILDQPADSAMRPYGEITKANPLEACLPSNNLPQQASLELMLATYNRTNTSHYELEWYEVENGHEQQLTKEELKTNEIVDNHYKNFPIPPTTQVAAAKKCFHLTTADATTGNAITVWLNSQNDPVLRVKAWMPLKDALATYAETNSFGLGQWLFIVLFCTYLAALLAFVGFLFSYHEKKD